MVVEAEKIDVGTADSGSYLRLPLTVCVVVRDVRQGLREAEGEEVTDGQQIFVRVLLFDGEDDGVE